MLLFGLVLFYMPDETEYVFFLFCVQNNLMEQKKYQTMGTKENNAKWLSL